MNLEQPTPRQEVRAEARSVLGGLFDEPENDGSQATVANGPYAEQLPVAGMAVGEIRRRFRDRFDIDPRSQAVINGNDVDDEVILQSGQTLMFMHRAGEKGGGPVRWGEFSFPT